MLGQLLFRIRMHWGWLPKVQPKGVLPYTKIRTVGLLLYEDPQHGEALLQQLQKDGKQVRTLRYFAPPEAKTLSQQSAYQQHRSFSAKSINPWGLLESVAVNQFLSTEYDLLINTSLKICPYLEQIQRRSHARLKVGLCQEGTHKPGYQLLVRSKYQSEGLRCSYTYLRRV